MTKRGEIEAPQSLFRSVSRSPSEQKKKITFAIAKLGYRNAGLRRERLRRHIKELQKEIKELEDDRNY